jgi:pilus assembly protein Flp/PilA
MLITRTFLALQGDRKGVTAVEYGLIAGLIAVAIIAAITLLGTNLSNLFHNIATNVSSASA